MREDWPFWKRYLNLAQPRLNAKVLGCSDEFFGAAERLIDPSEPVFIPDKYDDNGKWMDGWESRRKRDDGHDWCVVRLGAPARLLGVDIATLHFNGNQPQAASIEAACADGQAELSDLTWHELLPRVDLGPDSSHRHPLDVERDVTHLRLNIFPDGGVARLRAYGVVQSQLAASSGGLVDLAAVENGGSVLGASDEHFGCASNLLLPGRGVHMGDGWETARRRGPGHDWCVVELGREASIERVEIDTAHFKGNFPHKCSLEAARIDSDQTVFDSAVQFEELLPRQSMQPDHQHRFELSPAPDRHFTHVRLNMYPDGGVSRLRVYGRPRLDQPPP